jgi:hypothetical protein
MPAAFGIVWFRSLRVIGIVWFRALGVSFFQADFGLSTSDADRVTTKARTGQLQVSEQLRLHTADANERNGTG